jgi:hypothetical protein
LQMVMTMLEKVASEEERERERKAPAWIKAE